MREIRLKAKLDGERFHCGGCGADLDAFLLAGSTFRDLPDGTMRSIVPLLH